MFRDLLTEAIIVTTVLSAAVTILALIALFLSVADAKLLLFFSVPIFIICAWLVTYVIKDGWQRLWAEVTGGFFTWPF